MDMLTLLERMVKIEGLIKKTKDQETRNMLRDELARVRDEARRIDTIKRSL